MFRQAVTAEDMFLQMGNKTPSSASCEDMVVSAIETMLSKITLTALDNWLWWLSWMPFLLVIPTGSGKILLWRLIMKHFFCGHFLPSANSRRTDVRFLGKESKCTNTG